MSIFDSNLTALRRVDGGLAAAVREAGGGVLTVASSKTGVPTALHAGRAVHSTYDPVREASAWAEEQRAACQPHELLIVFGVGLLYHVEALLAQLPPDTTMAIIVPDVKELHDACMARSMEGWIDRVHWIWGDIGSMGNAVTAWHGPLRLLSYRPAVALHVTTFARLEEQIRRSVTASIAGRLHVAVVGPIYGGSLPIARYTASALESLGHRVTWVDHSLQHGGYEALEQLRDARHRLALQTRFGELLGQVTVARLAEDPPDLVLALAQAPLSLPVLDLLRRKRFVTAMWFVENYRHLTYWRQVAGGYDHWFVIQRGDCEEALRAAGARDVSYLPMAADPAVHRPVVLSGEEEQELRSDIAFVGAGYANRRAMLTKLTGRGWTFKIWGNEWDGAVGLEGVVQRGGARVDTATCVKVFNAAKINLNLHSWTGTGLDPVADFVNPRTFEIAACGAFQLVDERSLLRELFTEQEMATFSSADGCVAGVRHWLADPAQRSAYASAARQHVLAEHTYAHRMTSLLGHLGVNQPDRIGSILRGDRLAGSLAHRPEIPSALQALLTRYDAKDRVEVRDLAAQIRRRGPTAVLDRDELLILMLDEYRQESRDLV